MKIIIVAHDSSFCFYNFHPFVSCFTVPTIDHSLTLCWFTPPQAREMKAKTAALLKFYYHTHTHTHVRSFSVQVADTHISLCYTDEAPHFTNCKWSITAICCRRHTWVLPRYHQNCTTSGCLILGRQRIPVQRTYLAHQKLINHFELCRLKHPPKLHWSTTVPSHLVPFKWKWEIKFHFSSSVWFLNWQITCKKRTPVMKHKMKAITMPP